ncbi:MAG: hypothetical protein OWQ54_04605 [Sulfolobaceae archaeon]|nr:hypothetical protein [Sulfolobaceae archaeon]
MKRIIKIGIDTRLNKGDLLNILLDPEVALLVVYDVKSLDKIEDNEYMLNKKYIVQRVVYPNFVIEYITRKKEKEKRIIDMLRYDISLCSFSLCFLQIEFTTSRLFPTTASLENEIKYHFNLVLKVLYDYKEVDERRRVIRWLRSYE